MSTSGVVAIFGRVSSYLRSDMDRHGIPAVLGEGRVFPSLREALALATSGARAP
jgi:hypothetical protein